MAEGVMPLLFREVNNVMWWDPFRAVTETWLSDSDLRGDALKSLRSKDNTLSVYWLESEDGESLERVVAAFAAQREKLDNVDFALFEAKQLEEQGFVLETIEGKTPDPVVNAWHRDVVRLSAGRILDLAGQLQLDAAFCRRRKFAVRQVIKKAIDAGWIDTSKMYSQLLGELG